MVTAYSLLWQPSIAFLSSSFFFSDRAPPEIYPLSLHDALPIWPGPRRRHRRDHRAAPVRRPDVHAVQDRKSTRLNSSHANISYAVFCLKKKNEHDAGEHDMRPCARERRDDAEADAALRRGDN